ncbi:alpha/beta hydrolase family protein [Lysobacter terrae]
MSIGAWEPFWLGAAPRQLYAALHGAPGATGVLLVPPLLHELPRSRRFLVEVANEFAAMGFPCLRFDFHGTGDSSGDGEALDFASMQHDLDLASEALRARTGVARVAVVAWRGSALAVQEWMERGGDAQAVVLWEPIWNGEDWLRELVEADAGERAQRPPPRAGIARITDPADGQLMGFPASPRLRSDLQRTRLSMTRLTTDAAATLPVWAIVRADLQQLPVEVARVMRLPANAPSFNAGAAMDATFFLTPAVRDLIVELGQALRREAVA